MVSATPRRRLINRGGIDDDRGAVAVVVALFMLVAMVLMAFVVDIGMVYATKAKLQNAADAAALAAASQPTVLCTGTPPATGTDPCAIAGQYGVANGVPLQSMSVQSNPSGPNPRSVRVTVAEAVHFVFGPFVGRSTGSVSATAVATRTATRLGDYAFFTENDLDNGGNPSISGDVYAGHTFTLFGNSSVNGDVLVGGLANPASDGDASITGSAQVTGDVTATGQISTQNANSVLGAETQNATVPAITAVEFATSVGLLDRIAIDQADPSKTTVMGNCSLANAVSSTTVLVCSGDFSTASNNDWRTSKPNLRTIIAANFSWTGQQTMGTWPTNPFLMYATGTTGFSGAGGTTLNGYMYAPTGGMSRTGSTDGDFRVITADDITVRGNMSTAQTTAYEDATQGKVSLTE